ncbi:MAG: 3-hydroxyacyl-ACP dehydratase FabZ [Myxococcota bacterium]|nr:3-hydroxyacyl-ACP dehydratase FabZ [Myxococcota bacterium]
MSMHKVSFGRADIEQILPHREPFLFVDEVIEIDEENEILATRYLDAAEPHFNGHFPGEPIMPGVLIIEALAQTSGLLIALSALHRGDSPLGRLFYLARSDVKWTRTVVPGDTLLLHARIIRTLDTLTAFKVKAYTRQHDIANGTVTLARVKRER